MTSFTELLFGHSNLWQLPAQFPKMPEWHTSTITTNTQYNTLQDEKSYTLSMDLPGVTREELKVEIVDSVLKIVAKNKNRDYNYTYEVPKDVDQEKVEAKLENGVLTVTLNKKKLEKKSKLVEVK